MFYVLSGNMYHSNLPLNLQFSSHVHILQYLEHKTAFKTSELTECASV